MPASPCCPIIRLPLLSPLIAQVPTNPPHYPTTSTHTPQIDLRPQPRRRLRISPPAQNISRRDRPVLVSRRHICFPSSPARPHRDGNSPAPASSPWRPCGSV